MLKAKKVFLLFILIVFIHIFLLYKLVFLPTPELFIYPYLTNLGLKPYQQIFDQHFPGLMFLPINFDNLGMKDEVIARIWLAGVVVLTQILIFFVGKQVLKSESKALLANLLYLLWQPFFEGWVLWLDTFLPIFLLVAFYNISKYLNNKSLYKNIFYAGLFLGLGVIFKQVLIPLSFLIIGYIFLLERKFKTVIVFLSGFLPPVILMLVYLLSIGVFGDFWFWTITFNLTTFAQFGRKVATFSQFVRVLFISVTALSAFLYKEKKIPLLLLIFIFFPIVEIYNRFDLVHFQPALPFVIIATVLGFTKSYRGKIGKFSTNNLRNLYILVYLFIALRWLAIFYGSHISNHVFFFDQHTKNVASKIKQYSTSGEKIFIFGEIPNLYQMSQTLPAGDIFVFQFPWFLRVTENKILEGIIRDRPNIIVADRTVVIEGQKITDFGHNIDQYIRQNYQVVDKVGATDILRRREF